MFKAFIVLSMLLMGIQAQAQIVSSYDSFEVAKSAAQNPESWIVSEIDFKEIQQALGNAAYYKGGQKPLSQKVVEAKWASRGQVNTFKVTTQMDYCMVGIPDREAERNLRDQEAEAEYERAQQAAEAAAQAAEQELKMKERRVRQIEVCEEQRRAAREERRRNELNGISQSVRFEMDCQDKFPEISGGFGFGMGPAPYNVAPKPSAAPKLAWSVECYPRAPSLRNNPPQLELNSSVVGTTSTGYEGSR